MCLMPQLFSDLECLVSQSFIKRSSFIVRVSCFNMHIMWLYKWRHFYFLCGREDGEFSKFISTSAYSYKAHV